MKILKEAYTRDEIKQRVVDTRNIISALQDSLSILQSSLLDADPSVDKDECDKLARYTRTYEIDIEDMMKDFSDDFESFLIDKEEEEDFEDDYEYEDEEEVVEESLKESWGLPNYQYEVWYTSSSGNDKLLGASDSFANIEDMAVRQMDKILSSPWEDKIDKSDIAKSFRIIDTKINREIKSDKLEDHREEALEMLLESAKKSLVESEEDIELIRKVSEPLSNELDELEGDRDEFYVTWNFGLDGQGNITASVDVNPHPRFNHDPQKIEEIKAKVESAFEHNGFKLDDNFKENPGKTLFGAIHYQIKKSADNLNESASAGSVEDFLKKMEGKSKAEAEKIVRQAKGNPNADKAYRRYLGLTEDAVKTSDGKWAYAVQPHKIDMDLYDIRFIDGGAKASSKRFETYDDAVKFIKKNAKNNNWIVAQQTELKDKSDKLTNFGKKIASAGINEDTEKIKDGKWTNKGDTGETHGTFATKKEADAQRRAMFANGFKG